MAKKKVTKRKKSTKKVSRDKKGSKIVSKASRFGQGVASSALSKKQNGKTTPKGTNNTGPRKQ